MKLLRDEFDGKDKAILELCKHIERWQKHSLRCDVQLITTIPTPRLQ
jgi:hypothetical protein